VSDVACDYYELWLHAGNGAGSTGSTLVKIQAMNNLAVTKLKQFAAAGRVTYCHYIFCASGNIF